MLDNTTKKEAEAIVESIHGWIKSFLRKRPKSQSDLLSELEVANRYCRSKKTKKILKVLLELMDEEITGYSSDAEIDILDSEFLEVSK